MRIGFSNGPRHVNVREMQYLLGPQYELDFSVGEGERRGGGGKPSMTPRRTRVTASDEMLCPLMSGNKWRSKQSKKE